MIEDADVDACLRLFGDALREPLFRKASELVAQSIREVRGKRLCHLLPGERIVTRDGGSRKLLDRTRPETFRVEMHLLSQAALQLVDGSQQKDQVFVVNFGDDAYLDQDYTDDVGKLRAALMRTGTRGSTALYDAVIASVDHLNQTAPQQKKVLLLVTDGHDNASQATYSQALHKLQSKDGPVLYTIALLQGGRDDERDRQALRKLCEQTGGTAFFPSSLDEVQSIAASIAKDIRSQYVIGYRSSNPQNAGTYHAIQVQALSGQNPLRVSTRAGYYSGELGSHQ
jgi:Ca-activated chloride channel homolog